MEGLDELLGESAAIQGVRDNIRRLLARPQTGRRLPSILIQGETGTGKGLVARLIHRHGPRAEGPFVDVNCAAIPETLLEAELFGFERGAFTDARRAKPGLFQTAHRGTIFLDEIGLLPEALQAKLLKVLEEQAVRRLGSTSSEPVDVWIISATNTDLHSAIAARRFREDLYHRLAVLTLQLPPLRERDRDVVLLAERFLARACIDYRLPPKTFSPEAQTSLLAHPWPGNIRELGNMIERVALLAEGPVVSADILELPVAAAPRPAPAPAPASLDEALREHLLAALTQTGWNISRTAALLGISRNTLRARIEKFGLRAGPAAPAATRRPARAPFPAVAEPQPPIYAPTAPASAPAVAATSAIRWETRRVTLLQANLVTPAGDDELPDTSRALDLLLDKLRTFGGRIEALSPLGAGAVFGLEPVEDAPRRAAHAAMAIQKAAERGRRGDGEPFTIKVGIHVGSVLVGQSSAGTEIDAEAKRAQWSVLNVLLASAEPDSILLTAAAAPFIERRFDLTAETGAVGTMYRLQGRERKGLALEGEMSWFVGRRQELDLLKSRLASARAGRGQIVGIVGEAGIGKSRLLYEFRQALRGEAITYIEGHCLSYGSAIPYLPVLEILRHGCRVTEADTPETVAYKLRVSLKHLEMDPEEALSSLLQFLGFKESTEALAASAPDAIRHRSFQILRQMFVNTSRQRPLIIAVEDMHWIDTASEALGGMVESLEGVPLLLILTYRPGYRSPWLERSHMTQIALQPLSGEESLNVLGALLPPARLSESVAQLVLTKAEGNPFFLEELARTVCEQSGLSPAVTVPDTVQDVILARINRLPECERRLIQSAAVIGKDISLDVLRAITDLSSNALSAALGQLRAADFLYEASSGPEVQYSFKHTLTHEVAYGSLRPERRREFHARIVEAIEARYPDRLIEQVERLAHHAFRGELWNKAAGFLRQAGARAAARSASREAIAYFEQALVALGHLPETRETLDLALDLRFDLQSACVPLGDLERMLTYLQEAERLAEAIDDGHRLGRVFASMTHCFWWSGELDRAVEAGHRALAIATSRGDSELEMVTNVRLGQAYFALGEYSRVVAACRACLDSLKGDLIGQGFGLPVMPAVVSLAFMGRSLALLGDFRTGVTTTAEAVRVAEHAKHPYSVVLAHWASGDTYLSQGNLARATAVLERARALCDGQNFALMAPIVDRSLGEAYALAGRHEEALSLLRGAVDQLTAMKFIPALPSAYGGLSEGLLLTGRLGEAFQSAERALGLCRIHRQRGNEAYVLRVLGEIHAAQDPPDALKAEAAFRDAVALAEAVGNRALVARCELSLGKLCRKTRERDRAEVHLTAALFTLRAFEMRLWLDEAKVELAALRAADLR